MFRFTTPLRSLTSRPIAFAKMNAVPWLVAPALLFHLAGCGNVPSGSDQADSIELPPTSPEAEPAEPSVPQAAPLQLSTITPPAGITDGNVFVMIKGEGFIPGTDVLFGETPAREVVVANGNLITLATPPLSLGLVDITLRTPDGRTVTIQEAFESIPTFCTDPADNDGDGRTNCEEKVGYEIRVDSVGFGMDPRLSKRLLSPATLWWWTRTRTD